MKAERSPLRIHPAIAVAVIVLCLALIFGLLWRIHVVVMEVVALVALGLAFRYWPPMLRWFAGMPGPHRFVFGLIFAAIIAGHFTLDNRRWFPFITWEIFSIAREDDPVSCREFIATTVGRKDVRLLTEQLFPSIIQFNPPADNDSASMTALIHALARAYDEQHPGDQVQRVDLVLMSVKLHPAASEFTHTPSCELLKRYDVSSDRSR